jgi:DNA-binding transcriptional regulator GbsR (MarR family)
LKNLETTIKDFIATELDYFLIEDDYWYLFNSASKEQEGKILELLEIIKNAKNELSEIQDDIYNT